MAKILGIQIAGILFGLFMAYYSFLNYKKREFTIKEFSFWAVMWVMFSAVSLFPSMLDPIVRIGGFLRALDLLVIIGFLFLILTVFYTYTIVRKNQKQIETILREMAIKKNKK